MMKPSGVRPFALFRRLGGRRLSEFVILARKLHESGKATELQAKGACENVRDGAVFCGESVKTFFTRLFVTDGSHGGRRATQMSRRAPQASDLVILDVNLPDIAKGLDGGAVAYLTLPIDAEQMVANVKSLLRIDREKMELRENQGPYRRIIDMAIEGVWTIDAGAITTYVNRQMAAMLGQSATDMIGRSLYDFMEPDTRVWAERNFERARQGLKEQFDFRFQRADGTDLWAIVSTHPIFAKDGQFAGALVLITDITDRKRAEKANQEAETLRSVANLAAAVSHEINNPLMAVLGNLQLLETVQKLDAYGRARLEAALAAADEIKEKVRRFGWITRLELAADGPNLPPMLDLEKSIPAWASARRTSVTFRGSQFDATAIGMDRVMTQVENSG